MFGTSALRHSLLATTLLALGCRSGGTVSDPGGSISVSLSVASATVLQGGMATTTVSLMRAGGFTGTVEFAVTGTPAGVTGTLSNAQTSGSVTTALVTIQVAAATVPGTYPLTLRGMGSGVAAASAIFTLTVQAAPVPGFTLTLTAPALGITQGQNGQTTVNLNRTGGFSANVTLVLDGAPTGATGVFATNPAGGVTSLLTVSVGAGVAPGVHNLTVRGTAPALADATVPLTLTVSVAGNYTLAASAVSILQGGSGNSTVTLTRSGGFSGNVTLSLEGAPTGVGGSFTPNPATALTSTLALTVGGAVIPGNYTLTVRGTTPGLADQTTTFQLTVTAPVVPARIAYALADQPSAASYTADPASQFNGLGGLLTVTRSGTGQYEVTIPGFGAAAGESRLPFVHAVNSSSIYCVASSWTTVTTDFKVQVSCTTPGGAPTDSRFTLFAIGQAGLPGALGFGYSGDLPLPAVSRGLNSSESWSSTSTLQLTRDVVTPTGRFIMDVVSGSGVRFPILLPAGSGVGASRCLNANLSALDAICYAPGTSTPADGTFIGMRVEQGRTGFRFGAVAGTDPTTIQTYTPPANFWRNSSGGGVTINHSAAGTYRVTFAGLARPAGAREVSLVAGGGLFPVNCIPSLWSNVGNDLQVEVRCFINSGALADTSFLLVVIE